MRKIAKLTNTTKEHGTNEFGIMQALVGYGLSPKQFYVKTNKEILAKLNSESPYKTEAGEDLWINYPVIACVDKNQHWIVIIGEVKGRFLILDSSNSKRNKVKNGFHSISFDALVDRWKHNGIFYGIVL
jgi:ABC-type bacteriocin/lantibiotic exporter with double-glycine peptidase domain